MNFSPAEGYLHHTSEPTLSVGLSMRRSYNAFSLITAPRDTLTRIQSRFNSLNFVLSRRSRVLFVNGIVTTTTSEVHKRESSLARVETRSKWIVSFPDEFIPSVFIPKDLAKRATAWPIPPAPMIPIVFPFRKTPRGDFSK